MTMIIALTATIVTISPTINVANGFTSDQTIGSSVLLTAAERADVRRRKAQFAPLLRKCAIDLAYKPVPSALFGPDPHYGANGVSTSTNNAKQLSADSRTAYRAGLCYVITGESKYAVTAQRILDAWSSTLTRVTTEQGKGDINFNLQYMIAAASWIRGVNGWDGVAFGKFLRTVVLPNSTSYNDNNHGMWGAFLEASAAAYLGDASILQKARDRWEVIFKGASSPDGTLIREIERSDTSNWRGGPTKGIRGLAYTHYFLLPASMAAKVFADQGQPVWSTAGGKLLQAAFTKAAGWTLKPDTFPFYASNGGKLQDIRGVTYFPMLLRYYSNPAADAVLRQGDVGDGGFLLPLLFPRDSIK